MRPTRLGLIRQTMVSFRWPASLPTTTSSSTAYLQDPAAPLIFLTETDLRSFTAGSLIVDVSCDVGMGFSWARPTSFTQPTIEVATGVHYYAVDHSPSYLWNSATWEISAALLPHIETLLAGAAGWNSTPTIHRAIEIRDGVVLNPSTLAFQHRGDTYPHLVRTT